MIREIRTHKFRAGRQLSSVFLLLAASTSLLGGVVAAQSTPPTVNPTQAATDAAADEKAYAAAIAANAKGDVLVLERYASTAPDGQRRNDALMWLVATYRRMRDIPQQTKWAEDLLRADPTNALGLAVVANADSQLTMTSPSEPGAEEQLSQAKQALRELDGLRKPEGMQDAAFENLKVGLARSLNGAIGYAYFQRHDYVTARTFLRKAATLAPMNAQYTYALALADLEGREGNQQEGYKMLARSVNLTRGTPSGAALAQYAKQKYKFAGGTDANWEQYLAVTQVTAAEREAEIARAASPSVEERISSQPSAATTTPPAVSGSTASTTTNNPSAGASSTASAAPLVAPANPNAPATIGSASTTVATATTPPVNTAAQPTPAPSTKATPPTTNSTTTATQPSPAPTEIAAAANNGANNTAANASSAPAAANAPMGGVAASASASVANPPTAAPEPPAMRADTSVPNTTGQVPPLPEVASVEPEPNIPPRAPIRIYGPDKPVSLGILIETATTSKESRANVVNALGDMVRRLRAKDEAFLVSFSNHVVFEQDLTNNANALVETMDKIKPQPGTALFDAVAFAAGHLKRVAANENRALLVISDGSNETNQVSPLELSGELSVSSVKIFCIGLQADTAENQQRLTALANATGGKAIFVASASDFRGAAREVAAGLGLPF